MKIINLTQHDASEDQLAAGVMPRSPQLTRRIQSLITFNEQPSPEGIEERASKLALLAKQISIDSGADAAMIGGAPFLMSAMERKLHRQGIDPLYAFSLRESAEEVQPDGSVRKVAVFRHAGFVVPPG